MKNFHFFTCLAAGLFLAAAIATYQPATHTSGGSYSYTNGYSVAPVNGNLYPDISQPTTKAVGDTSLPVSLTPAFSYTIGKVRLMGAEGTRPFPAELSVTELTEATLPPLDQGMVNVTDYAAGYRMLPDGMVFNGDISIVLPYDSTLLPTGFTPDDIVTYYYDVLSGRWMAIERDSVCTAEALVYSKVNHFTDFINAVIKTPEMPETSAFTPTSIKELEAANPLEGLQLIQAPTANNSGTANLSYQLEIPAGRQGMQPNLALTYSSSGGNGWLGVGWDISVPSITVETRWGVPRYDYQKESEVYVYGGEQLVEKDAAGNHLPMPHRTNQWRSRHTTDTRFYPRADETFDSIVRHGTEPYDYWWSVTDRNGITHYYGKSHTSDNVDYNAVLADSEGNIARWALTESVDPNGNAILYFYDHVGYSSTSDFSNGGIELYLKHINYTACPGNQGKYDIVFNRQDQGRADVTTNCRYGFKETSAATLCNISVLFGQDLVRTFYFVTENTRESGYKTRLKHLLRIDGKTLENTHCDLTPDEMNILINKLGAIRYDFGYYDYPKEDELFSSPIQQFFPNDGVSSSFMTQGFTSSALGATKGKSWSLGGSAALGLGANVALTTVSAGGNFDYSRSQSEGLLTLIDLNGDGLSDKVFKKQGAVCYRPQIRDDEMHFHFGPSVPLSGITDFLKETSNTIDWGLQLSALFTLSGGWPTTSSTTSTYFADINNDGLPDLVTPAGAMFNHLDINGNPVFTHFNEIATTLPEDTTSQTLVVTSNKPCDGGIIFDGEVNPDLGCTLVCDTVWTEIAPHDSLPVWLAQGYECYWANYGKRLYGYRCTSNCDESPRDPDMEAVRVWVAQETGVIDVRSFVRMFPDSSESRLQSHFVDGIIYSIQLNTGNQLLCDTLRSQHDSIIWEGLIGPDDTLGYADTIRNLHVNKDDILFFRLRSVHDHSFDKVFWKQEVFCHDLTENDVYGRPRNTYQSDSDFVLCGQSYFKAVSNGTAWVDGRLVADGLNHTAIAVVKLNSTILDSVCLNPGAAYDLRLDTFHAVSQGDEIRCEVYVPNNGNTTWGNIRFSPRIRFCGTFGGVTDTLTYLIAPNYRINNYSGTPLDTFYHKAFGPLYRGWGQFAHNNNRPDSLATSKIKAERLLLPRWLMANDASQIDTSDVYLNIDPANVADENSMSSSFSSIYEPTSDSTSWVEMTANMEFGAWLGYGNITYASRDVMANTRCVGYAPVDSDEDASDSEIDDYDYPVPNSIAGAPVNTIRKQNKSKLNNSSYGVGYVASVGQSESNGTNWVVSDYMDMNGDGYPDFLAAGNIQYTMPWGGIGQHIYVDTSHKHITESSTLANGNTFGASYPLPKRGTSGRPSKAKISFDGNGSVGASHGGGEDHTAFTFADVNGDGLPDKVKKGTTMAALNKGYEFLPWEPFSVNEIGKGESENIGLNIGANFDIAQASIGGGLGVNISHNQTESTLMDMNGDGLPDKVSRCSNGLMVSYNLGNGQFSAYDLLSGTQEISYGRSFSESVNVSVTAGFTFCSIAKVTVGVQASPFNRTFSRDSLQLVDVNGDGFVDVVTSHQEDRMTIRYNRAGKTNLLREVTNFTGSRLEMDYELSESSNEQPHRSWNLSSVITEDTLSPVRGNSTHTAFLYRNPHYDRFERIDFGYDTVITRQYDPENGDSLYRFTVQGFNNHNFNKRGWKKSESVHDKDGNFYVETLYEQQLMDMANGIPVGDSTCPAALYVSYEAEITRYYEGEAAPQVVTEITRKYDDKRNVIEYVNKGDTSRTDEYLKAEISYRKGIGHNLISLPDTIVVTDIHGDTLRYRTATYDSFGRLSHLEQHDGDSISESDFIRDPYGNVKYFYLPRNYRGQRMFFHYDYDPVVSTYPVKVEDAFGYTSESAYEYPFGKPNNIKDINGMNMQYQYDKWGRLECIIGPYEAGNVDAYTLRMEYHPRVFACTTAPRHSYAVTVHYDVQHPTNPITTTLLCDGLGRLLQTKKDAELGGTEQSLVSGRVEYDCFGRTVVQYYPFAEPLHLAKSYSDSCDAATRTLTHYDILDRPVKVILPTGDSTRTDYGFGNHGGKTYFRTTNTDPKGIAVSVLTGTRKQQVKTVAPMGAVTTFEYAAMGELLSSTDPVGQTTTYAYDMLGRMVQRVHSDAGTDTYRYDAAGNLLSHATQNLSASGDSIRYHYTYNRLDSIVYPLNAVNNVRYTYGSPTAAAGQRGRIAVLEDASGFQQFKYGMLGEVVENIRTFALPNENNPYTFKMNFSYDSWNRTLRIDYPDGESVTYGYDRGGMLESMKGTKNTTDYRYIDSIRYNEHGLKAGQWNGNGAYTLYTYDTLLRLSRLRTYDGTATHDLLQDIGYTYDPAGNITQISNVAALSSAGLGGPYAMTYAYDSLYRLQGSTGMLQGGKRYDYMLKMAYEANGRILRKSQLVRTFTSTSSDTLMNYAYLYNYGTAPVNNRVQSVADTVGAGPAQTFTWDANGNLLTHTTSISSTTAITRTHCWDEENRLCGSADSKHAACYFYDAGGERFYKFTGMPEMMMVNGEWHTYHALTDPVLYASPYMVVTPKGYTKHYYAESERVASKGGGGGFTGLHAVADATWDMAGKRDSLHESQKRTMQCLGVELGTVEEDGLKVLDYLNDDDLEAEIYWQHGDHLGSASWVTNRWGKGVQYLYYLPWGEPLADQRLSGYATRYTFSGKERDEETSYGYFGARYYNSDLSIWLSVDPMADKYPGVSPYTYCANNPVVLKDPDGRIFELYGDQEDVNEAIQLMNNCFPSSDPIFGLDGNKVTSRELTNEEYSNFSMEQKAFYHTISSTIADESTTSIEIVRNSNDILIGSFYEQAIDIGDINAIGEGAAINCYSTFGHEVAEQRAYQNSGGKSSYLFCHFMYGIKAEEEISGYLRGSVFVLGASLWIDFYRATENDEVEYIKARIKLDQNGNVQSVSKYNFHIK